jgi:hypothetical protein
LLFLAQDWDGWQEGIRERDCKGEGDFSLSLEFLMEFM